jgi:hypothetical protein
MDNVTTFLLVLGIVCLFLVALRLDGGGPTLAALPPGF